jgi:hypothetical protein
MKKLILVFITSLFLYDSHAQLFRDWIYDLNHPTFVYGFGNDVVCDKNNNAYVGGTVSDNFYSYPILIKIDPTGSLTYIDTLSLGNGGLSIDNLFYDDESTVYATGQLNDPSLTIFIAAYDTTGSRLWLQTYHYKDSIDVSGIQIVKSQNGFLYTMGNYYDSIFEPHIIIMKTDLSGNLIWMTSDSILNLKSSFPTEMIVSGSDMLYITGNLTTDVNPASDVFLACYDSSGNVIWLNTIGGTFNDFDFAKNVKFDSQNNLIVSAFVQDTTGANAYISKCDTAGNVLWEHVYFLSGGQRIVLDKNDNIYYSAGVIVLTDLFAITKIDSAGNPVDSVSIGLPGYNGFSLIDMAIDDSSNVYITGNALLPNGATDIVVYKLDSNLNILGSDSYSGVDTLSESAYAMTLDNTNKIYVAGNSNYDPNFSTSTICLIKYLYDFNTNVLVLNDKTEFSIYPNPTNNNVTIDLKDAMKKDVTVEIKNYLGSIVFTSTIDSQSTIDVSDLSAGMYLVNLMDNNGALIGVGKLVRN